MNSRLMIGALAGLAGCGVLVGRMVMAQGPSAKNEKATVAGKEAVAKKPKSDEYKITERRLELADTLPRHCDNCNLLAMSVPVPPWPKTPLAKKKTPDDIEFEAQCRKNMLENYLAGNVTGPFHADMGPCVCGHIHDLVSQREKAEADAEAARQQMIAAAKRQEQLEKDPAYQAKMAREEQARHNRVMEENAREQTRNSRDAADALRGIGNKL